MTATESAGGLRRLFARDRPSVMWVPTGASFEQWPRLTAALLALAVVEAWLFCDWRLPVVGRCEWWDIDVTTAWGGRGV